MFIHIINLKFQYLIIFTQHRKPSYPSFYLHCIPSFVKKRQKNNLGHFAWRVACPWLYKRFNQNCFKKSRFEPWEKQFMQFLALDITAEINFLFPSQFLGWTWDKTSSLDSFFLPRGFKLSVRRGKMLYDVLRQVNCRSWHPWHHFLVPSTSHCEIRPDWRGHLSDYPEKVERWKNNFLTFGETNASLPYVRAWWICGGENKKNSQYYVTCDFFKCLWAMLSRRWLVFAQFFSSACHPFRRQTHSGHLLPYMQNHKYGNLCVFPHP